MSRCGATHGRSAPVFRRPRGLGERGPPDPVSTETKLIRPMSAGPQYGGRQEQPVLVRVADVPRQGQAPGDLAEVGPAMVVGLPARLHRCDVASGKVVHFAQLPCQAPARCGFPHRKPVVSPGTFTAAAIDPMVVALTLLGHEEAGEFGAEFGDVGPEGAQLEPGPRDPGVHGVPGCSSTTTAHWCCRNGQGPDCGLDQK